MDLHGRVAIVTGGAKRIGKSISLALAESGADVLVHYGQSAEAAKETVELIRSSGRRADAVTADLHHPQKAATEIFEACRDLLGQPTVLVNSAAIFEPGTVKDTSADDWSRHLAINLEAPFALTQAFANGLDSANAAAVVNIVDWRAEVTPPGHLAYTISKAGLLAMTRVAAQELAPDIRVNAIAPGPMLPPPGADDSYLDDVVENLPLRKSGSPEDVAKAVIYLCTSDFITGSLLHVDGGQQYSGRQS